MMEKKTAASNKFSSSFFITECEKLIFYRFSNFKFLLTPTRSVADAFGTLCDAWKSQHLTRWWRR